MLMEERVGCVMLTIDLVGWCYNNFIFHYKFCNLFENKFRERFK